jgi:dipeptidase E
MKLLLISNSTNPGEPYLDYPKRAIGDFLGRKPVRALFIPYAAVTFPYEEYESKVAEKFLETGHQIESIHKYSDQAAAVMKAEAIVVGGGNTWKLLKTIIDLNLTGPVRDKVLSGTPYIGWSAGSNMACPTIMTTNDMPVVFPASPAAFNLIPFQINPHYTDAVQANHAGETREQRIEEFLVENRDVYVAGLREGTMLLRNGDTLSLSGSRPVRIFRYGKPPEEFNPGSDLSFLLKRFLCEMN